jgi:hypothetical protein
VNIVVVVVVAVVIPKVLVQIDNDTQADDGILFVLITQQLHCHAQQLRHKLYQLFSMWNTIEDFQDDIA